MILQLTTVEGEPVLVLLPKVNYIGQINSGPSKGCSVVMFDNETVAVRQSLSEIINALGGMAGEVIEAKWKPK